jgi:hypothetical protein
MRFFGLVSQRPVGDNSIPTWRYVAPRTSKIHTPITLGIRLRTKPPVLKARKHRPCGFDSHRPLHFLQNVGPAYARPLPPQSGSANNASDASYAVGHNIKERAFLGPRE